MTRRHLNLVYNKISHYFKWQRHGFYEILSNMQIFVYKVVSTVNPYPYFYTKKYYHTTKLYRLIPKLLHWWAKSFAILCLQDPDRSTYLIPSFLLVIFESFCKFPSASFYFRTSCFQTQAFPLSFSMFHNPFLEASHTEALELLSRYIGTK